MRLALERCTIRKWRLEDAPSLAKHANNRNIAFALRDLFPHPYAIADANEYLDRVVLERPPVSFCIEIEEAAVGGIGIRIGSDVHKYTAELGYWLGEEFWGRGVMSEAVNALSDYFFRNYPLHRIWAETFSNNPASARILEKSGFVLEGQMKNNVVKNGALLDSRRYAKAVDRFLPPEIPDDDPITDRVQDPAAAILIMGSGRSGTTWLSQIVDHAAQYRQMFEPFEPHQVPRVSHFRRHQYLRPANDDYHYVEPARQIVSGQLRNHWVDQFNRCHVVSRRLIKDIRCLLFAKWLGVHFPHMPIVYMLRHPLAVVHSRLQLNWHSRLDDFLEQRDLLDDHLRSFVPEIERANTEAGAHFERHFLIWCVENSVPLNQFRPGEICLMFYERLYVQPEAELRRLFAFLSQPYEEGALVAVRNPAQTRPTSAIHTGSDVVRGWKDAFTPAQIDFAMSMLRLFGLDRFYTDEFVPVGDGGFI